MRHAQVVQGVFANYHVTYDPRDQVELLVGEGPISDSFAPFVHSELPGELAKLRDASAADVQDFAQRYGGLGPVQLAPPHGGYEPSLLDPSHCPLSLPWIRAHAWGTHICLAITEALSRAASDDELRRLLLPWDDTRVGRIGPGARCFDLEALTVFGAGSLIEGGPTDAAHAVRGHIINANLRDIYRYVEWDRGTARTYFGYTVTMSVIYWHLADVIDGGIVKRCEADGCGGFFIQTDPRQRYCPKRWRQRESACALRMRQRRIKEDGNG